jgi:hypothetical protein
VGAVLGDAASAANGRSITRVIVNGVAFSRHDDLWFESTIVGDHEDCLERSPRTASSFMSTRSELCVYALQRTCDRWALQRVLPGAQALHVPDE